MRDSAEIKRERKQAQERAKRGEERERRENEVRSLREEHRGEQTQNHSTRHDRFINHAEKRRESET